MKQSFGHRLVGSMNIGRRLTGAFLAFAILLLLMAGVGAWRLAELSAVTSTMAGVNLRIERLVGAWLAETKSNAVRATVLTYTDDIYLKQLLTPQMEATTRNISQMQKEVEGLISGAQPKSLFAEIGSRRAHYLDQRKQVLDRKLVGQTAEAQDLLKTSMLPAVDAYVASIKNLADYYVAQVVKDAATAEASAASGRNVLIGFCAAGVLIGILFSWWITLSITGPIRQGVAAARRVADGDLSASLHIQRRDETGQLLQALSEMTGELRTLLGEVAAGANAVADGSAQIAQGNLDLSQRTEEQASTLEQTASSMEELTSTVEQNAQNAQEASRLAVGAAEVARKGGQVVGQVVSTMSGISESSRKIAEIIGVIDGIAFQTNILALNAAVEAARAGEQGRGFAVVATEVRTLAQRSAAAAKEIKTLIGNSVDQVEAGSRLVDAAGRTMEEIVGSVKKVSDLIAEIAAAGREQSSGIGQVNTAVMQMDQVVQQNASLVEEATAATESLRQEAGSLLRLVSRFNLDGERNDDAVADSHHPAPSRTAAPAPIKLDRPRPAPALASLRAPQAGVPARNGTWTEF